MKHLSGVIAWADVGFSTKRAHRDRVFIERGQIIRESSVHVSNAMELGGKDSREAGDETCTHQSVHEIISAVEL